MAAVAYPDLGSFPPLELKGASRGRRGLDSLGACLVKAALLRYGFSRIFFSEMRDHSILGSILGPPIVGNSHIPTSPGPGGGLLTDVLR